MIGVRTMLSKLDRLSTTLVFPHIQGDHRALAACLVALLPVCGVLFFAVANGAVASSSVASAPYLTAPVLVGNVTSSLNVTGTLQAVVTAKVGSQLSGQIEQLLVGFNDHVTKGQIMARLDSRMYQSRVRAAEAALEVAKARIHMAQAAAIKSATDVDRAQDAMAVATARENGVRAKVENLRTTLERKRVLSERGVLSQSNFEDLSANLETTVAELQAAESEVRATASAIKGAQATSNVANADVLFSEGLARKAVAELEQARTELERTEIRATTDGIVIGRDVEVGQTVAATLEAPTLFFIAQDLHHMEVHAKIDQADIGRIKVGQRARFSVDAYAGRVFHAEVTQIRKAPTTVQNVVTYTIILSASNADSVLLPGMTAVTHIILEEAKGVLKVPNAALRYQPRQSAGAAQTDEARERHEGVVWVLQEDGRIASRSVRIGCSDAIATEVKSGSLSAGETVIIGAATPRPNGWFSVWRVGS
jgi:HlyD family secretion protein